MAKDQRTLIRRLLPTAHKLLLNGWLEPQLKALTGDILVVGAGKVPYQDLLPNSRSVCCTDLDDGEWIDVKADAHNLPFQDQSFDSVIAIEVFEHLKDPARAACELDRVLRPDGVALVTVPFMFRIHGDPFDFQRFTAEGLNALFEQKFEVTTHVLGNRLQVVSDLVTTAARVFVPLRILNHLLCRWPLGRPSHDCPSGYATLLKKRPASNFG